MRIAEAIEAIEAEGAVPFPKGLKWLTILNGGIINCPHSVIARHFDGKESHFDVRLYQPTARAIGCIM